MNILVLSVGTRNKIIQYLKKELQGKGKVIATDMSRLAPALYEADAFYIVPKMTETGYIEQILEICEREDIKGILSLIDPELSLLAKNKKRFAEIGVLVIGSDYEVCECSLNKWKMYITDKLTIPHGQSDHLPRRFRSLISKRDSRRSKSFL